MALGWMALIDSIVDEDVELPIAESTAIASATYNPARETLVVEFTDSTSHRYSVDFLTAKEFAAAPSAGTYFNSSIRNAGSTSLGIDVLTAIRDIRHLKNPKKIIETIRKGGMARRLELERLRHIAESFGNAEEG